MSEQTLDTVLDATAVGLSLAAYLETEMGMTKVAQLDDGFPTSLSKKSEKWFQNREVTDSLIVIFVKKRPAPWLRRRIDNRNQPDAKQVKYCVFLDRDPQTGAWSGPPILC